MPPLPSDCFDYETGAGGMTRLDHALAHLREVVTPIVDIERVPLAEALGRILAADQIATRAVPPFDNSAMDGWAVRVADLAETGETRLPVDGRIAAGHPLGRPARAGFAYRIFTGAPLPDGADAVVIQERARETSDGAVVLPAGIGRGDHVRRAGASVPVGAVPLAAGTRLWPQHIGVAATMGLTELPVRRRLRAAIFSTGDEVVSPGLPLPPGALYDANRYSLAALLTGAGCEVRDLGIVPDDPNAIRATLAQAAPEADLVVTSGGVSVGGEDHVKEAVAALGQLHLWRLAIKPGKPLALGQIGDTVFLGLPGNPVAVMVTFFLIARPLIAALAGATERPPQRYPLPAAFQLEKPAGRREFPRARLVNGPFGPAVTLFGSDSSGILTSVTACDGLVELPEEACRIVPGDSVPFIPFSEMLT